MDLGPTTFWNIAEIGSAVILFAALAVMVKVYRDELHPRREELQDWKLVTIGLALYIAVKTHFTVLSSLVGIPVTAYPWYVTILMGGALLSASLLVFIGFSQILRLEEADDGDAGEDADTDD